MSSASDTTRPWPRVSGSWAKARTLSDSFALTPTLLGSPVMIGHLSGRLLAVEADEVEVEVAGVGYRVSVTTPVGHHLTAGEETSLWISTQVREDSITLYGFTSRVERRVFERLLAVSGVGPRLARSILSGLPPAELVAALAAGDTRRLCRISGVGRKTAERLVLELRESAATWRLEGLVAGAIEADTLAADLLEALDSLGYRPEEAQAAVREARAAAPDAELEILLRDCLRRLSKV